MFGTVDTWLVWKPVSYTHLYLDSYDENDRLLHTQNSGSTLSGMYRGAPFREHFDLSLIHI